MTDNDKAEEKAEKPKAFAIFNTDLKRFIGPTFGSKAKAQAMAKDLPNRYSYEVREV